MLSDFIARSSRPNGEAAFFSLRRYQTATGRAVHSLPRVRRLLLENLGRAMASGRVAVDEDMLAALAGGDNGPFPFFPSRIILQDASGIPLLQDYVALKEAGKVGADLALSRPTALVVDHGTSIHAWNRAGAADENLQKEIADNAERYRFLKWCSTHVPNLTVVAPGNGIVHSVNLERFCTPFVKVDGFIAPDSVIGSDSHTTMTNGAGILSWGAGGLDILRLMVGKPAEVKLPSVVRLELTGELRHPAGAADAAYALAEFLRQYVPAGAVVECEGPALRSLSVYDRATLANMSPEYGTWLCLFPLDDTIRPLLSRRGEASPSIDHMLSHARDDLLASPAAGTRPTVQFDLSSLSTVIAGPSVPWKRRATPDHTPAAVESATRLLPRGSIVLAAIASCTTTSNPRLLIEAALVAKKAVASGLKAQRHAKTSFSPGSPDLADFLKAVGLLDALEQIGFTIAAYGCASCVGNSGSLLPEVEDAIARGEQGLVAILSGNRNFPHRVQTSLSETYLASPALVVAQTLAGTIAVDLAQTPVGTKSDGSEIWLSDLMPTSDEVSAYERLFLERRAGELSRHPHWEELDASFGDTTALWATLSPHFICPPFGQAAYCQSVMEDLLGARILAVFGDEVTTDHISPIGTVPIESPAGRYLRRAGLSEDRFSNFMSWRGNADVMRLGTFSNPSLRNLLAGLNGPISRHVPSGIEATVAEIAELYTTQSIQTVILAGERYGVGSARDWAAKGTRLLGVRAVAACSFERIHRSNLVAAGVIPVLLPGAAHPRRLELDPWMIVNLIGLADTKCHSDLLRLEIWRDDTLRHAFHVSLALESEAELDALRHGGTLGVLARELENRGHGLS